MEWLQSIIDSGVAPVIVALILGLMTAISPCPLATNIAAVGYIGKSLSSTKRVMLGGLMYALGRVVSYSALGIAIVTIIRGGSSAFGLQKFISDWGDRAIGPMMLLIGMFMLFGSRLKLNGFGISNGGESLAGKGGVGAFLLGAMFAMAFCPTSAVFYFGMLIPMSVTATEGYILPTVFGLATSIPVILVAWIFAFSANGIGKFYKSMNKIQKWLNIIVGILFVAIGVYYITILLI